MSHESESLLPVAWWPKGWSAGSDRGLSNEVEESLSRGVFSNRCSVQVAKCVA